MPSEVAKAFTDFYGSQSGLLETGQETLLGRPLEVVRFERASRYAILRTPFSERTWTLGEEREMVEFALPRDKHESADAVQRAKVHRKIKDVPAGGDIITRLALGFTRPDGIVTFLVERRDEETENERIHPSKSNLSCAVYNPGENPVMLAWANYDNGHPRQFSFTQLPREQIMQGDWRGHVERNTIPDSLTVYHQEKAVEVYRDPTEDDEEYRKLGAVPMGQPFDHSQLNVKVSFSVHELRDRLFKRVRVTDKQGRPHLLFELPWIGRDWYFEAQGSSQQFANIEDHYQMRFIYGSPAR